MMVFTVRTAHILPHMVQVPSLAGGALFALHSGANLIDEKD